MAEDLIYRRQFLKAGLAVLLGAGGGSLLKYVDFRKRSGEFNNYSIDDYINAVIQIESGGNEMAERYERHLNDHSYDLGQLLTKTAKNLKARYNDLPMLGESREEIKENLFNPNINRQYTQRLFEEEFNFYEDPFLALAAYHAGHFAPRNARCQEQLNDIYEKNLTKDGIFGEKTKKVLKIFQEDYELEIDGIFGKQSYEKLQSVWETFYPLSKNSIGIMPKNRTTLRHVEKFKKALKNIQR